MGFVVKITYPFYKISFNKMLGSYLKRKKNFKYYKILSSLVNKILRENAM